MSLEEWVSTIDIRRHFKKLLFKLEVLDPAINHDLRRRWFNAAWQETVKYYSGLKLTYSTDKLVAIAGIVELVKAAHISLGRRFIGYSAGVWAYDFPEQLLWYLPKQEIKYETENVSRRHIRSIFQALVGLLRTDRLNIFPLLLNTCRQWHTMFSRAPIS
jgi:hypothetical protein